jgi:hypothetical protein
MVLQLSRLEVPYSQEKLQTHFTIEGSMRRSTTSELRMLRMIAWHVGLDTKCCFCHQPLLDEQLLQGRETKNQHLGGYSISPIKTKITLHHVDGNHYNNEGNNRKLAHTTCHKSFHMRQRQALKKSIKKEN